MKVKKNCKLVFKKKFQMQLDSLTRYLADISPQVARSTNKIVFSNIGLLKSFPQLGKKLDESADGEKRLLIIDKYLIMYLYRENEIHLEMIIDERLDYHNYM